MRSLYFTLFVLIVHISPNLAGADYRLDGSNLTIPYARNANNEAAARQLSEQKRSGINVTLPFQWLPHQYYYDMTPFHIRERMPMARYSTSFVENLTSHASSLFTNRAGMSRDDALRISQYIIKGGFYSKNTANLETFLKARFSDRPYSTINAFTPIEFYINCLYGLKILFFYELKNPGANIYLPTALEYVQNRNEDSSRADIPTQRDLGFDDLLNDIVQIAAARNDPKLPKRMINQFAISKEPTRMLIGSHQGPAPDSLINDYLMNTMLNLTTERNGDLPNPAMFGLILDNGQMYYEKQLQLNVPESEAAQRARSDIQALEEVGQKLISTVQTRANNAPNGYKEMIKKAKAVADTYRQPVLDTEGNIIGNSPIQNHFYLDDPGIDMEISERLVEGEVKRIGVFKPTIFNFAENANSYLQDLVSQFKKLMAQYNLDGMLFHSEKMSKFKVVDGQIQVKHSNEDYSPDKWDWDQIKIPAEIEVQPFGIGNHSLYFAISKPKSCKNYDGQPLQQSLF